MAQKRIALAYHESAKDGRPHVIYCGNDADACGREVEGALNGGVFARTETYLLNSPVTKYANVRPAAPAPVETAEPVAEKPKGKGKRRAKADPAAE